MINSLGKIDNPADAISALRDSNKAHCVHLEIDHIQHYFSGKKLTIGVLCYVDENSFRATMSSDIESLREAVTQQPNASPRKSYENLLMRLALPDIDLAAPMKLDRIHIPKPWGQEIWYTGIEQRGVCGIQTIPLPWLLDVFGALLTGTNDVTPILLKILDPLPDEIYGDLYFELHNEKREVYVVTHVDNRAWPDSVGKIRYGFSQAKISEYADAQTFKQAYLEAVEAYHQVRKQIDARLDRLRSNHQVGKNDIVPVAIRKQWQREIDPHLLKREEVLRKAMNSFSALRDLRPGDVVQVHPHTPHSLQHGVRVIEFQTPHYERYILSFAQKVVTQDHWDTEKALDQVQLEAAGIAEIEITDAGAADLEPIIADFEEFTATRILLKPGMNWTLNAETYCLVIGVQGTATIGNDSMQPEDGYYIAAPSQPVSICNNSSVAATFLVARPKISQ
jgi:hypothetical protein